MKCQLIVGVLLPICAMEDAFDSMGEDTADEAVVVVVRALVGFLNIMDFPYCAVFVRFYLKMKLFKGLAQNFFIVICSFLVLHFVKFGYVLLYLVKNHYC